MLFRYKHKHIFGFSHHTQWLHYRMGILGVLGFFVSLLHLQSMLLASQLSGPIIQESTSIVLEDVYVVSDHCQSTDICSPRLWMNVKHQGDAAFHRDDMASFALYPWNTLAREYEEESLQVQPVYAPDGTLQQIAFHLSERSNIQRYPSSEFYTLRIVTPQEDVLWTLEIIYETHGATPLIVTSELNERLTPPDPVAQVSSASSEEEIEQTQFTDLSLEEEVTQAAEYLASKNIVSGYPDGTFRPLNNVNRAEAAKFLMIASSRTTASDDADVLFSDTDSTAWYMPYILRAANDGIINGYPDGSFRPADTVNTVEFLKMLTLAFDLQTDLPHGFIDVENDQWFAMYAGAAHMYKLFPKRPDYLLLPDMDVTREEMAIALYTILREEM